MMAWMRFGCVGLIATGIVACSPLRVHAADQPNVIFILCDDLGWGDLGCFYQNTSRHTKRHRTPHLDRMAAEGLQMRAHYCPAPVCAPSRASLLTGTHQGHCSIRDNQFDKALPDVPTLGTVMQGAGYRTVMIGKYGLQGDGDRATNWPSYPTRRGFDEFFGYVRHRDGHLHYPAHPWPLGNSESHQKPVELWDNDEEVSAQLSKCYTTDLFTAKTKQFLIDHAETSPEKPFFVYLAYDTPHAALQTPTVAYPEGSGLSGGIEWLGQPGQMINTAEGEIDQFRHPDYTDQGWSDVEERFATMVRRIDHCVGDLLQTLRDLNIDEETLVVLSSDNGPHRESYLQDVDYTPESFQSYGPFDGIKRDCYEGGIRMPTLAWWPGRIAGGRIDSTPSQFHDWLTTFADLADTLAPARADGVSLVPTLTGSGEQVPSQIYVEYMQHGTTPDYADFAANKRKQRRRQMQVVHVDGYKGIRLNTQSHESPFQIFDVKNDPKELKDLAGSSGFFDQLQQRMLDRVTQLRRPNPSAPRPYDEALIAAVDDPILTKSHRMTVTEGVFSYCTAVSPLAPDTSIRVTNAWSDEGLGWLTSKPVIGMGTFEGVIEIPASGVYLMDVQSSADMVLRLHDAMIVDTTGQAETNLTIKVGLEAGRHPIGLHVRLVGDGISPQIQIAPARAANDPSGKRPLAAYLVRQPILDGRPKLSIEPR